jgi:hypothetical protein
MAAKSGLKFCIERFSETGRFQQESRKLSVKSSIFASFWFKLFLVVSLADLGLTSWLLSAHPNWVVESNPVANWWLAQFGLMGLVFIKTISVVLLMGVCYWLARLRPRLSRGVLAVGCLTVLGVVGYSVYLVVYLDYNQREFQAIEQQEKNLEQKIVELAEYNKSVKQVYQDLESDQITLKQAANYLVQTKHAQSDTVWAEQLQATYGSEFLTLNVAQSLIRHFRVVDRSSKNPKMVERLEEQLEVEFAEELKISTRSWEVY